MIKKSCAKSADGYVNYGATVMAKGFVDEAIECFQKALEYYPNHFEATYNLGKKKMVGYIFIFFSISSNFVIQ